MSRPARIGLVLGGGGLVGHAWHVGVLAGIAETTGWSACSAALVVGTSAGAVVGAELRCGLHPAELLAPGAGAAPTEVPRPVLGPRSYRPAAAIMAARGLRRPRQASLGLVAAGLLPRGRRDAAIISDAVAGLAPGGPPWPPGLWVCATRLHDGERVVFRAGTWSDLGQAVAASCAMAGFFAPVPIAGHDHVDGGARSVTNADVVAGEDLDLVVVSSSMSLEAGGGRRPTGLAARAAHRRRLAHGARLAQEVAQVRRRGTPVVVVEPGPDDVAVMGGLGASMDFERRSAVGRQARFTAVHRFTSTPLAEVAAVLASAASPGRPRSASGLAVP